MMEAASVTGPAKNLIGFAKWLTTEEGAKLRLSVSIATFSRNSGSDGFVSAARAAGIDTHVIRERRRFDREVIPQLREIVARVSPDIIQTHNGKSHLLMRSLPDLRVQRSWFAFQHGYQDTDLRLRLYNQVDRLTLRSADRVVSVCQAFAARTHRLRSETRANSYFAQLRCPRNTERRGRTAAIARAAAYCRHRIGNSHNRQVIARKGACRSAALSRSTTSIPSVETRGSRNRARARTRSKH